MFCRISKESVKAVINLTLQELLIIPTNLYSSIFLFLLVIRKGLPTCQEDPSILGLLHKADPKQCKHASIVIGPVALDAPRPFY